MSAALLVLTLLALVSEGVRKALAEGTGDLGVYLRAARAVTAGESPWDASWSLRYYYPIFPALLLVPLSWLPQGLVGVAWTLGKTACLFWALSWAYVTGSGRPTPRRALLADPAFFVVLVAAYPMLQNEYRNVQIDLYVLAACIASQRLMERGREGASGGWLAVAVSTKLTPVLLLGHAVQRARWRQVAVAIGLSALLALLPTVWIGAEYLSWLQDWRAALDYASEDALREGGRTFSLTGVLSSPSWSPDARRLVRLAVAGSLVAITWLWTARSRFREEPLSDERGFSAWLLVILLISPISGTHHLVLALPAWAMAVGHAMRAPHSRKKLLLPGAAWALILAGGRAHDLPLTLAGLLLLLALFTVASTWWQPPAPDSAQPPSEA